jgi:hypothetical protein
MRSQAMSRTVFNLVLQTATIAATGCNNEPPPPSTAVLDGSNTGIRDAVTSEKPIDETGRQQTADDKPDPTGTWICTFGQNNKKSTLVFKLDGDKLTGTLSGGLALGIPIVDGTFKDGELSFSTTKTLWKTKFVFKYKGKVTGDTIKGILYLEGAKDKRSVDWEGIRSKD